MSTHPSELGAIIHPAAPIATTMPRVHLKRTACERVRVVVSREKQSLYGPGARAYTPCGCPSVYPGRDWLAFHPRNIQSDALPRRGRIARRGKGGGEVTARHGAWGRDVIPRPPQVAGVMRPADIHAVRLQHGCASVKGASDTACVFAQRAKRE